MVGNFTRIEDRLAIDFRKECLENLGRCIILLVKNSLRFQAVGVIVALTLQFILGMVANLFVRFPENGSPQQFWKFAWSQLPVAVHIIIGFALLLGSLTLVIRSFIKKDSIWKIVSTIGFLSILIAVYGGVSFIPSQKDTFSFLMALGFIAAFLSYVIGIYLTR